MAFDVEGARKAGYTDAEIASHLAKEVNYDIKGAKSSGYSDSEVIAHLSQKEMPRALPPAVPTGTVTPAATAPMAPTRDTGVLENIVGAGETGLSLATGAIPGAVGAAGGTLVGLAQAIRTGQFGTQQAADMVERYATQGQQALTYAPRTDAGQQQAQAVGTAMQALAPIAGLNGEMQALAAASKPITQAPRAAVGQVAQQVADVVPAPVANVARAGVDAAKAGAAAVAAPVTAAADAILSKAGFGERTKTPTMGTGGSAGAAGTDVATMRRTTAQDLPVPIDLTEGQATRDFEQLRFEGETAKDARLGAPLRERSAEQNKQLGQNFEALIDDVGATAPNNMEAARVLVDRTLVPAAAKLKTEYRAKYNAADKAGETAELVSLQPLADYLNENRSGRTSAPILNTIAEELKVKGVGDGSLADGSIVGAEASLKQAEAVRKAVNKFVKDTDPNDLRVGAEIKGVIDKITEGKGGELYKEARQARQRYAQLFEDNASVSQLMKTRRGTSDRQVALENVFNKAVLSGDRESLGMLRRTLDISDQKAGFKPGTDGPGAQAWREMKGATLRHLLDESTKGVGTDVAGNPIFSAAKLKNSVRALEKGEKLDFILGKKQAQTVRDIVEIAEHVKTMPPGTVNTSNTASVLLAALAEAGTTGALTGLPVPAISVIKALTSEIKDRKLAARVRESLGPVEATNKF